MVDRRAFAVIGFSMSCAPRGRRTPQIRPPAPGRNQAWFEGIFAARGAPNSHTIPGAAAGTVVADIRDLGPMSNRVPLRPIDSVRSTAISVERLRLFSLARR